MTRWNLSDRDGFLAWYDATVRDASGYAARLAGRQAAPDLVQDAYLSILKRARSGPLEADGPGLAITTIRHRFVDRLRSAGAERHRLRLVNGGRSDAAEPVTVADDPLTGLGERDRAALVLRYVDGYSVPEVADALGLTVHATESVLTRAKQRARERSRGHG